MSPQDLFLAATWAVDLPVYLRGHDTAALRELLRFCEEKGETGRIWTATSLEVLRRFLADTL